MDFLRKELEPLEIQRVGKQIDEFVHELERYANEEIREYNTRFENQCKRAQAQIGKINFIMKPLSF